VAMDHGRRRVYDWAAPGAPAHQRESRPAGVNAAAGACRRRGRASISTGPTLQVRARGPSRCPIAHAPRLFNLNDVFPTTPSLNWILHSPTPAPTRSTKREARAKALATPPGPCFSPEPIEPSPFILRRRPAAGALLPVGRRQQGSQTPRKASGDDSTFSPMIIDCIIR
jgi:hypothetical protein